LQAAALDWLITDARQVLSIHYGEERRAISEILGHAE
jgi:hypothetical protein